MNVYQDIRSWVSDHHRHLYDSSCNLVVKEIASTYSMGHLQWFRAAYMSVDSIHVSWALFVRNEFALFPHWHNSSVVYYQYRHSRQSSKVRGFSLWISPWVINRNYFKTIIFCQFYFHLLYVLCTATHKIVRRFYFLQNCCASKS